ncbi:MAG: hypothetical protein ACRD0K_28230 [Egibacteraceae bacterium]
MVAAVPAHVARPLHPPARRPAAGRTRPELRIVAPARGARRYVALLLVVGALGVFGVVSLNALAAESAFAAQRLEHEVGGLDIRYEELTAEVAALQAPDRVHRIAVQRLGMIPADEPGYLLVTADQPAARAALEDAFLGVRR